MALPIRIEIGGRAYDLQYSANALRRLEQELGRSTQQIGLLLVQGRGGFAELQAIFWAGLEGARLKSGSRRQPYTMDEAGDLIDEAGGAHIAWQPDGMLAKAVIGAWTSAFPTQVREEPPEGRPREPAVN